MTKEKKERVFTCAPKYRNDKSQEMVHSGAGKTVVVEYTNQTIEYPGVFSPKHYMQKIVDHNKGNVIATWVKDNMDDTIIRLAR